jgi:sodium/hydrogen antiporter
VFGLDSYHVLLTSLGACVIVAYWLPRFFSGREPAASALLIAAGALAFIALPGMPRPFDPTAAPRAWEITSELTLIVALFGAGLRIDNIFVAANWGPTVRLLAIAMPVGRSAA